MYVDEQTWRVEREAVLFGEWFCVGRLDELGLAEPSRVVVVDVAGESVLVTSDEHGALHAAYNVCRHRGSPAPPRARRRPPRARPRALRCPYHSWTYGLDGRLLQGAARGRSTTPRQFALNPVGVEAWGGFVFVHLSPERGPAARRVRRPCRPARWPTTASPTSWSGATFTYDVAANYKVLLENYNECYHCGPVHPELCRLVPSFAGGGTDLDWDDGHPAPRGRLDVHDRPARRRARRCRGSTRTSAPGTRATSSTRT